MLEGTTCNIFLNHINFHICLFILILSVVIGIDGNNIQYVIASVLTLIYTHIRLKVLVPKGICQGNAIFSLAYAAHLSFIFLLLTRTNESLSGTVCLWITGSSVLKPKQIQPNTTHLYLQFN